MNSFLHDLEKVDFSLYKPEDVDQALKSALLDAEKNIEILKKIKQINRTFENTVLANTRCMEKLEQILQLTYHLQSMDDQIWTKAQSDSLNVYMKFALKLQYDKDLFVILKSFSSSQPNLDNLQKRLLGDIIKSFEDYGIGLPEEQQKELKKLSKRHASLAIQFSINITKQREKNPVRLLDKISLDGLSQEFINQCREDANHARLKGYLIKANDGTFDIVMTSCSVASTRKKMVDAYSVSPSKINHKLLLELLGIRYKMASILGYKTPAHMYMRNRMIIDPNKAIKFLRDLDNKYLPKAKQEYKEICDFVSKLEQKKIKKVEQYEYDTSLNLYYTSKMFERKYSVNLDEVKEHFEFTRVRDYMFKSLSVLYGVRFERLAKKSWHIDVEVYKIIDSDNRQLAEVHCDWFARDHKKGHAWMNRFYSAAKGSGKHHIGCVIMNMPIATSAIPSLMSPEQTSTMWHEFGHFMHQAFDHVTYPEQSMMAVKRDFIEAPSQIMENWALHDSILPNYAISYKTGKPLDKKSLQVIKQMDLFNIGIKSTRQHFLALIDLELHTSKQFTSVKELAQFTRNFRQKTLPGHVYTEYATLGTFGHIASGYIAGYYTYKWSDSLQADLFTRFESEGVLNPQTGTDYRKKVLSRGNEADPDELVRSFLGREPNPDAMLKRDGII